MSEMEGLAHLGRLSAKSLFLIGFYAFLLLCFAAPAMANGAPPGPNDFIDDPCPEPPDDEPCLEVPDYCLDGSRSMRGTVDAAIAYLEQQGVDILDQADTTQNCGPGLILEEAIRRYGGGVYLFYKNYGKACNGHSEDVVVFPDGCAYDVIGGAGAPGARETLQPICCCTPPEPTQAACMRCNFSRACVTPRGSHSCTRIAGGP